MKYIKKVKFDKTPKEIYLRFSGKRSPDFYGLSIEGENGVVTSINCVKVNDKMKPIKNSNFKLKADLVLLAMGFIHPTHKGMIEELGVEKDSRGNVLANTSDYKTSIDNVFSAGDMRRGQSLVVWAIREGRQCASSVDLFLSGERNLPF